MSVTVRVEQGQLELHAGRLRGGLSLPLAQIQSWDFLYEILGRRFLAFHLGSETHFLNLPRLDPVARQALRAELVRLVGQEPDLSLLELERDNEHWAKLWEVVKTVGRYLRLFINPRAPLK